MYRCRKQDRNKSRFPKLAWFPHSYLPAMVKTKQRAMQTPQLKRLTNL
ncbi:Uncharacterised protein [Brucella intermedia]|uniref:Uncharacterized protein n=1 Tax=Brucella intermedia 229E TaxID=1337887 RepID=U4V9J1_9HYPH|nr:hypothetical protein Q644_15220 [Brucella intermedia 229E]SUA87648.1 Uncharacterised protein [Brucella intermedia]